MFPRMMAGLLAVTALSLSVPSPLLIASTGVLATAPEGARTLTTAELEQLVGKQDTHLYDSRPADAYDRVHIKGAVSMPVSKFDVAQLPKDKATRIIFYGWNLECTLAPRNAANALRAGYTNVWVYLDGSEGWATAHDVKR